MATDAMVAIGVSGGRDGDLDRGFIRTLWGHSSSRSLANRNCRPRGDVIVRVSTTRHIPSVVVADTGRCCGLHIGRGYYGRRLGVLVVAAFNLGKIVGQGVLFGIADSGYRLVQ